MHTPNAHACENGQFWYSHKTPREIRSSDPEKGEKESRSPKY
jgi:hypothetical protein